MQWSAENKLIVNRSKNKEIVFRRPSPVRFHLTPSVEGIGMSDCMKVLGITLQQNWLLRAMLLHYLNSVVITNLDGHVSVIVGRCLLAVVVRFKTVAVRPLDVCLPVHHPPPETFLIHDGLHGRHACPAHVQVYIRLTPTVAMGTAIKHPVPDWVQQSFVIFDIRSLWRSALGFRVPRCQQLQMTAEPSLAQDAL